ncbi:hypothetical protein GOV13_02695 [Candidatus Pacearchaeota archaeon]|nr:hypothetical protein [Candidatus Pacearchaeota archaeon]
MSGAMIAALAITIIAAVLVFSLTTLFGTLLGGTLAILISSSSLIFIGTRPTVREWLQTPVSQSGHNDNEVRK